MDSSNSRLDDAKLGISLAMMFVAASRPRSRVQELDNDFLQCDAYLRSLSGVLAVDKTLAAREVVEVMRSALHNSLAARPPRPGPAPQPLPSPGATTEDEGQRIGRLLAKAGQPVWPSALVELVSRLIGGG